MNLDLALIGAGAQFPARPSSVEAVASDFEG